MYGHGYDHTQGMKLSYHGCEAETATDGLTQTQDHMYTHMVVSNVRNLILGVWPIGQLGLL